MTFAAAANGAPASFASTPGMGRLQAATAIETSPDDLDGDGLSQVLEHQLAAAFLPRIFYDTPQEACSLPGALGWREPGRMVYFVVPKTYTVDIVYVLLYHEDCGAPPIPFTAHSGDAEPIVVSLVRQPSCELGWGIWGLSTEAHGHPTGWMPGAYECHVQNGAAAVLVARRKHGMFLSLQKCNAAILDHCSYGGTISDGHDEWIAINGGETDGRLHVGALDVLHSDWFSEALWQDEKFCGGRPCTEQPGNGDSPPPLERKIGGTIGGPLLRVPNSAGDLFERIGPLHTPQGTAVWQPVLGAHSYSVTLFRRDDMDTGPGFGWTRIGQDVVAQPRWSVPADLGCIDEACSARIYGYYKIEARAANDFGLSPARTINGFSFFPLCDGPPSAAPTALGPAGTVPTAPLLHWQPPSCAESFDVEVYQLGATEPTFAARVSEPELQTPSLECGTEHGWRVRGLNAHGEGPWSDSASFIPSCVELPPDAPADLVALAVAGGHDRVALRWTDRSQNERGFVVRRLAAGSNSWVPIADLEPGTESFEDQVPEVGSYFYKVYAYNAGGDNVSERAAVTLYDEPPGQPDTLRPRGCIGTLNPTLTWRGGGRSSQFYVRLLDARTGEPAMPDVTTTAKSVAVPSALEAGGVYMLRVWGINNEGWGPGSAPEYFVPFCTELDAPSIELPAPGCHDAPPPEARWTAVDGALGYHARLSRVVDVTNDVQIWEYTGPETSVAVPADRFAAGNEYRLKAKASVGIDGPYSPLRFFVVGCASLGRPGTPSPVAPNGGTVSTTLPTYTWEPAARAVSYTLEVWVSSTGPLVFSRTWPAAEVCDGSLCSARPARPLPAGSYFWRLRASNTGLPTPDGLWGPWAKVTIPALTPTLSVAGLTIGEDQGSALFRVRLENPPVATVAVSFASEDNTAEAGEDYLAVSGRLTLALGQEEAIVEVPILDDPLYEGGSETFALALADPAGAVLANSVSPASIEDDEPPPTVSVANRTAPEGASGTPVELQVTASGPSASTVVVPFAIGACTASAGIDFLPPKEEAIELPAGTTSTVLELSVIDDRTAEGHEVVRIDLGPPSGATLDQPWAELRIRDDDPRLGRLQSAKADFDRDGRGDLLWRRDGSGQLAVWTMDGNERRDGFLVQASGSPDPGWEVVATADFDSDRDADVVWRNRASGTLVLWSLEGGTVVAGSPLAGMTDLAWQVVGSGDLDRDGHPDLLWWHEGSGMLKAWLMTGWALREERVLAPSSAGDANWRPAALADFDGDGFTDLLWRHRVSGSLALWFLEGTVRRAGAVLAAEAVLPEWRIVGGWDVDDDGHADIVFQHADTKRLLVWYVAGDHLRCVAGFSPSAPTQATWTLVGPR